MLHAHRARAVHCHDALLRGALNSENQRGSGVYTIQPIGAPAPFAVLCDQTTDGGGYNVFQQRNTDNSSDFYR